MRLKYSKLVEFVESSNGAYSLQTDGSKLSLIFLSKLDAAREHYEDAVIKIYGTKSDERSEEHTSELQSHRDLHSFPTRRSSDLNGWFKTIADFPLQA